VTPRATFAKGKPPMQMKKVLPLAAAFAVFPAAAFANDPPGNLDDVGYIFTTLLFLVGGFLVFWMAAGFAMLEAGLVRSKNTTMQLTKNIALFSIAAIMYWFMGFNLMYPGDGWWIDGWLGPFFSITWLEPVGLAAEDAALDYASVGSDFFFQLMFCATTASIVSGTLAERIKLWPFLIFVVVLTGVIYPIEASWQWGGGWLSELGFSISRARPWSMRRAASPRWRGDHPWPADRQVRQGRVGQPDPGFEPGAGHARHLHPVARLVRLQRRLAAGHGYGG
jgi:hypothetical protein